jgi:histidinol phosphatase-like PHP family hydrolase
MDRDLHIHTYFSPCAEPSMTFDRIVHEAEKAGMKDIGFSDHPFRQGLDRHHEAIRAFRESLESPVRVWIAAELEVAARGRLVMTGSDLPLADYLIAAPSHYDLIHAPPVRNLSDPAEWADRLLTDLENVPGSGADAVAHPFFVMALQTGGDPKWELPFMSQVLGEMRTRRLEWMLDRFSEDGLALEISPRLTYLPVFEQFMSSLYQKAKRRGIRFLLGSDSHRAATVGQFEKLVAFMRKAELSPEDLWHPSMSRRACEKRERLLGRSPKA